MKLHEIISTNDQLDKSILVEKIIPYKKSLLTYYTTYFTSEPMLMVVSVTNATQYALIVPSGEINEAMQSYFGNLLDPDEEELIMFNSIMLKDL